MVGRPRCVSWLVAWGRFGGNQSDLMVQFGSRLPLAAGGGGGIKLPASMFELVYQQLLMMGDRQSYPTPIPTPMSGSSQPVASLFFPPMFLSNFLLFDFVRQTWKLFRSVWCRLQGAALAP